MTFNEQIEVEESKVTITISCNMRKYSADPKLVYDKNVEDLIPEDLKGKVSLISKPTCRISNTDYHDHTNFGQWIYEIRMPQPKIPKTAPKRTRTPRNKK